MTFKWKQTNPMGRSSLFDGVLIVLLGFLALLIAYPVYYTVMVSISTYKDIADSLLIIIPEKLTFDSYKMIFEKTSIGRGFGIALIVTALGTAVNMIVTAGAAWALSKKDLVGHKLILSLIIFTMLFEGGLVPYYLTIKRLGLINNLLVMILPLAVDTFFLFIMISFFKTLPASLEESAKLDGANDVLILVRIILPVSLPTMAAIGLFYAVARWNEWWHAMLFLTDKDYYPIQLILRNMLISMDQVMQSGSAGASFADQSMSLFSPGLKMASVIITTIPIMLVYPLLQRYFSKGIMLGSIKG